MRGTSQQDKKGNCVPHAPTRINQSEYSVLFILWLRTKCDTIFCIRFHTRWIRRRPVGDELQISRANRGVDHEVPRHDSHNPIHHPKHLHLSTRFRNLSVRGFHSEYRHMTLMIRWEMTLWYRH
jgi:hypothetical protein